MDLFSRANFFLAAAPLSFIVFFIWLLAVPYDVSTNPTLPFAILFAAAVAILVVEMIEMDDVPKSFIWLSILFSVMWILLVGVYGSSLFTSNERYKVLNENPIVDESVKLEDSTIRTVTNAMAHKKASKVLGVRRGDQNISSQYTLGRGNIIVYQGDQYWIYPLDYSSFFKWLNTETSPGYVLVSATDPRAEAELKLFDMVLSEAGYFDNSISRTAWEYRPSSKSIEFEINEDGVPHYIVTYYEKLKGWSIKIPDEVVTFNAQTGGRKSYDPDAVPEWVDTVIHENVADDYVSWHGEFVEGFWNSIFAQRNVEKVTGGFAGGESMSRLWHVQIGDKLYYFTGMTSSTFDDQSLISVRLVSARTGAQLVLPLNGFTDELGALESIESALGSDAVKWSARLPQLVKTPSGYYYTAAIVSDDHVFQKYAIMKADDPSDVRFSRDLDSLLGNVLSIDFDSTIGVEGKRTLPAPGGDLKSMIDELDRNIRSLQSIKRRLEQQVSQQSGG